MYVNKSLVLQMYSILIMIFTKFIALDSVDPMTDEGFFVT